MLNGIFRPSSLDALIFGYLAPIMKMPLPSDRLQLHILSFANLVRFVESIISIYLPLTESQLRQQAASRVCFVNLILLRNFYKHNHFGWFGINRDGDFPFGLVLPSRSSVAILTVILATVYNVA